MQMAPMTQKKGGLGRLKHLSRWSGESWKLKVLESLPAGMGRMRLMGRMCKARKEMHKFESQFLTLIS